MRISTPPLDCQCRAYLARVQPTQRLAINVKGKPPLFLTAAKLTVSAETKMLCDQFSFHDADSEKNYHLRFAKKHRPYFDTVKVLFSQAA